MKHLSVFTIFASIFLFSIFGFFNLINQTNFIMAQEGNVLGEKIQLTEETKPEEIKKPKLIEIEHPVKILDEEECKVDATSAVVIDKKDGLVMYEKNADEKRAIASITKLMTALVFLDHNPGWDTVYEIKPEDRVEGGIIYLYNGDKVTVKDLFYTSLVGSANTATQALISSTGMSQKEFVKKMNEKAKELGLVNTFFEDPTGLSDNNISTAREVAIFAMEALGQKDIRQATLKTKYEFTTSGGKKKIIESTDYLLENLPPNGIRIIGGKTGYTVAAGFCFTGEFLNEDGHELISVVLDSPTYSSRFYETKDLVTWVYNNYKWQKTYIEVLDF